MNRILSYLIITMALNSVSHGTPQMPDIVLHNGTVYKLSTPFHHRAMPLDVFFESKKVRPRLHIRPSVSSTANHRGYVAIWEIMDDTLFLKGIDAWQYDHEKAVTKSKSDPEYQFRSSLGYTKVNLRKLFPKRFRKNRVEADWFSGSLTLTEDTHWYPVGSEKKLTMKFKNGKIVADALPTDLGERVDFRDDSLKDVVEKMLGTSNPTTSEMLRLTKLEAKNSGIVDLTGLEHAKNLNHLNLWNNQITSLTPLSELTKLKELWLSGNDIADISALSELRNLDRLFLFNNQIRDISAVSGMKQLTGLSLYSNQISDLAPVSGLSNLQFLWLGSNQISDVSPLFSLKNLPKLSLYKNQISDISPLSSLTKLDFLELQFNQVDDITALASMKDMELLWISNNNVDDISSLAEMTNLRTLKINNNHITDISSLSEMTRLLTLHLHQNRISSISVLASMQNMSDLKMHDNHISDVSALSHLARLRAVTFDGNPVKHFYESFPTLHRAKVQCDAIQFTACSKAARQGTGAVTPPERPTSITLTQGSVSIVIRPQEEPVRLPLGRYYVASWTIDSEEANGNSWQLKVMPFRKQVIVTEKETAVEFDDRIISTLAVTRTSSGFSFKHVITDGSGGKAYVYLNGSRPQPPKLRVWNESQAYNKTFAFKYG